MRGRPLPLAPGAHRPPVVEEEDEGAHEDRPEQHIGTRVTFLCALCLTHQGTVRLLLNRGTVMLGVLRLTVEPNAHEDDGTQKSSSNDKSIWDEVMVTLAKVSEQ